MVLFSQKPSPPQKPWALIIAGPTCSGKSALALHLAHHLDGIIINADAMQCYKDLRIITARPSISDEQQIPHRLYGILAGNQIGNTAWWREQALQMLEFCWKEKKLPILCGGTGMYFHALIHGIAIIPEPSIEAREEARSRVTHEGPEALHQALQKHDPETAIRINPTDSQRIARAWEVWRSTGHGLRYWQQQPALPGADCQFTALRLDPPRPLLHQAIADRFKQMVALGACEEVKQFLERDPPLESPLRRAHGVPEISLYLKQEITLDEAIDQAITNTKRYVKRQSTWFKHHKLASDPYNYIFNSKFDNSTQYSKSFLEKYLPFIRNLIDGR